MLDLRLLFSGDHFSTKKEDNIVQFGMIEATVTEATKNSLTVIAPNLSSAASTNITVTKYDMVSNARSIILHVDQNENSIFKRVKMGQKIFCLLKLSFFTLFICFFVYPRPEFTSNSY